MVLELSFIYRKFTHEVSGNIDDEVVTRGLKATTLSLLHLTAFVHGRVVVEELGGLRTKE